MSADLSLGRLYARSAGAERLGFCCAAKCSSRSKSGPDRYPAAPVASQGLCGPIGALATFSHVQGRPIGFSYAWLRVVRAGQRRDQRRITAEGLAQRRGTIDHEVLTQADVMFLLASLTKSTGNSVRASVRRRLRGPFAEARSCRSTGKKTHQGKKQRKAETKMPTAKTRGSSAEGNHGGAGYDIEIYLILLKPCGNKNFGSFRSESTARAWCQLPGRQVFAGRSSPRLWAAYYTIGLCTFQRLRVSKRAFHVPAWSRTWCAA